MVKISNIKVNNTTAICNFYPENGNDFGKLTIDLTSQDIVNIQYPLKKCSNMYVAHAKKKLLEVCDAKDNLPDEAFCIWY